jgi:hypothetical protein
MCCHSDVCEMGYWEAGIYGIFNLMDSNLLMILITSSLHDFTVIEGDLVM